MHGRFLCLLGCPLLLGFLLIVLPTKADLTLFCLCFLTVETSKKLWELEKQNLLKIITDLKKELKKSEAEEETLVQPKIKNEPQVEISERLSELEIENRDLMQKITFLAEKEAENASTYSSKLGELLHQNQDLLHKISFLEEDNKKYIKLEVLKSEECKKLEKEKKILNKKIIQFEADKSAKQSFIDEMESEENKKINQLEEQVKELLKREATLQNTIQTTNNKKVHQLEEQVRELKNREITVLNTMQNTKNSHAEKMEKETKKLIEKISKLEAQNSSSQSKLISLELEKNERISSLEEQVRTLKHKEKSLQNAKNNHSDKTEKEMKNLMKKINQLEADNVSKQTMIDEKKSKVGRRDKEIKDLTKKLAQLEADTSAKKSTIQGNLIRSIVNWSSVAKSVHGSYE